MLFVVLVVMAVVRVAPVVTPVILCVVIAVVMAPVTAMPLVMFLHVLRSGSCRSRGCWCGGCRLARRIGRA